MCFGKHWSATSLTILIASSIFCAYHKVDWRIIVGVIFLAWKELIQLVLYYHLDDCSRMNTLLTVMAWIHISFQPYFLLLFISAFSKNARLYDVPLVLCLVFGIYNCIRIKELHPGDIKYKCVHQDKSESLCRKKTCSMPGKYHLAYGFDLASADANTRLLWVPSMFTYFLLSFVVPYVVGDWQLATINILVAFISNYVANHDFGEAGAMWCVNTFWVGLVAVYYALYGNPF